MQLKSWKDRATRCPICGGKACHWSERLSFFDRKRNCRTCGEGCFTPAWIYPIILAIPILCIILENPLYIRASTWRLKGSLVSLLGISGYLLSGWCMMWLMPLKPCPEKGRAFEGVARVTRVLDYSKEDVYTALSNTLRRSDTYRLIQRDPEKHTIAVFRAGYRKRWPSSAFYPAISGTLLVESRPDGRCGVVLQPATKETAQELEQICQLAERELELFHYHKINSGE